MNNKSISRKIVLNFLIFCVLCIYGYGQERPIIIERPVFDVWNSTVIEFDKIEITDSATIFHIDAYFRPNWWIRVDDDDFIVESGSDERLIITGAEGIVLGQETYMPASGTISFKLFFPPLKPGVTKIDFGGNNPDDGWQIRGIHLLPDAKLEFDPIPEYITNAPPQPLPPPGYNLRTVKVNGKLIGYFEGYLRHNEITFQKRDIITGETISASMPVAEDGTFSGEIISDIPAIEFLGMYPRSGMPKMFLFMPSGDEINIYIDLKKMSRNESRHRTDKTENDPIMYMSGSVFTASEINDIFDGERIFDDYDEMTQALINMNPDEFKEFMLSAMNMKLDELNQKDYSDNTRALIENNIKMSVFRTLLNYENDANGAYMRANNITTLEEWDKVEFRATKPDITFYSFLRGELNDNMSYLIRYPFLLETLLNVDFLKPPDATNMSAKERFDYFKEKFAPIAGTDQGVLFDLILAKLYAQQLSELQFFFDAEKRELLEVFKDKPAYAQALIAENDRLFAQISAIGTNYASVRNKTPDVPVEDMFDAILSKYRGKVVVVDFWATWCGPCIQAMETIKPLKDEMKDNDVVWLYLTGETSPLSAWTMTSQAISGEHYRVSHEQWLHWATTLGLQAIPTYMIYDKDGNQLSKYTGFPGISALKRDIGRQANVACKFGLKNTFSPFAYVERQGVGSGNTGGFRYAKALDWKYNQALENSPWTVDLNDFGIGSAREIQSLCFVSDQTAGTKPVINGKLYQTVTLEPGKYKFIINRVFQDPGIALEKIFGAVALGDELPDVDDLEANALGYSRIDAPNPPTTTIEFNVAATGQVTLGFVVYFDENTATDSWKNRTINFDSVYLVKVE